MGPRAIAPAVNGIENMISSRWPRSKASRIRVSAPPPKRVATAGSIVLASDSESEVTAKTAAKEIE